MKNFLYILLFSISIFASSTTAQDEWKSGWENALIMLDTVFYSEQAHLRLMRSYQNDADESMILNDIDRLSLSIDSINTAIEKCNVVELPNTETGKYAVESVNLKIAALKEYFEQRLLQIQVNNQILQKKLKNEPLAFKVNEINELKTRLIDYKPNIKQ
ncbi:MAG: hypothetical protein K8I03_07105 [Ignavibacteria bacterium]|nr:hypothetical protein [Ignavibacteria bacterium]